MKIAVTIVLCAILALANAKGELDSLSQESSNFQSGLFQKVSQSSDEFIKAVTSPFNTAYNKAKELISRAYTRVEASMKKAQGSLNALVLNIEKQFEIREQQCVDQYKQSYLNIKVDVQNRLEHNSKEMKLLLETSEETLNLHLEEIEQRIDEYQLVVITCFNFNPVYTTKCVFEKISEYTDTITEIGSSFNKAVTLATSQSLSIQRTVTLSNNNILKNAIAKLNDVSKAVNACPKM